MCKLLVSGLCRLRKPLVFGLGGLRQPFVFGLGRLGKLLVFGSGRSGQSFPFRPGGGQAFARGLGLSFPRFHADRGRCRGRRGPGRRHGQRQHAIQGGSSTPTAAPGVQQRIDAVFQQRRVARHRQSSHRSGSRARRLPSGNAQQRLRVLQVIAGARGGAGIARQLTRLVQPAGEARQRGVPPEHGEDDTLQGVPGRIAPGDVFDLVRQHGAQRFTRQLSGKAGGQHDAGLPYAQYRRAEAGGQMHAGPRRQQVGVTVFDVQRSRAEQDEHVRAPPGRQQPIELQKANRDPQAQQCRCPARLETRPARGARLCAVCQQLRAGALGREGGERKQRAQHRHEQRAKQPRVPCLCGHPSEDDGTHAEQERAERQVLDGVGGQCGQHQPLLRSWAAAVIFARRRSSSPASRALFWTRCRASTSGESSKNWRSRLSSACVRTSSRLTLAR